MDAPVIAGRSRSLQPGRSRPVVLLGKHLLKTLALLRRCAWKYEDPSNAITLQYQNDFPVHVAGSNVSGRMDPVATRPKNGSSSTPRPV